MWKRKKREPDVGLGEPAPETRTFCDICGELAVSKNTRRCAKHVGTVFSGHRDEVRGEYETRKFDWPPDQMRGGA